MNNNPSNEKIINQAIQFHLKGNISEAIKYYQYCIKQGFNDHRVFSNYGVILEDLRKSQEAEFSYRKAIGIKPDFAEAHSNLGNILRDLGNLQEAEISYRKAIKSKPDFAEAHSNLGNILRDLEKLQDAEISCRKAIGIKPDFAEAHYNLGNVFRDLGKLQEAEISYSKAIKSKPDFTEAHLNLGGTLRDLGKSQEAEISYRKAIKSKPDFAEAHYNLGNVLKGLGNLQEAEISYRKAIEIKPYYAEAHSNLGTILKDLGNLQEAFDSYLKAIQINPTLYNIYPVITRFLRDSDHSQLNKSNLKNILNLLLERTDVPHKELFEVFKFLYRNEIIINLKKTDSDLSKIEFLINNKVIIIALRKIIFRDLKLEKILTKARGNLCHHIAKNKENINDAKLQFIIALGEQCFLNEYVYSFSEEEKISTNTIIQRCRDGEINETNISILSCYFPLYRLLDEIPYLKFFNSYNQSFKELIEFQITEPLKEIELSQNIKQIESINDDISQKVKSQYEENPYPRWRYGNHSESQKISIVQAINNEIKPNSISKNVGDKQLKVLVAGCGTGQQILHTQIYKNAQVTGIDLSLSSLSYAQRKIKELEINNVKLIQIDILEVNLLEEKFDIIFCSGVLHHMDDPSKGLQALLEVLENNGFLKLGLYSEVARLNIVEARNYIASKNLQANEDSIRDFRETVFSRKVTGLNSLTKSGDFYTLSSCRDLCFHAQEHRFSIREIQETLTSNKLKFLGFLLPQSIKSLYTKYFPEDKKQTNLQNWGELEEKYTNIFVGMYQFWVYKI